MKRSIVAAIGHVALRAPDVDACVRQATGLMGLTETARTGDGVYLTEGAGHHSLHYVADDRAAADHIGLEAADGDALVELRRRLDAENVAVLGGRDALLADSVRFVGPEGFVFEVYVGMPQGEAPQSRSGVRPTRFGHVTLRAQDPPRMCEFVQRVLDFRVSDAVGGGFFVRCNVDHHGLGILPGPGELHHHAWEVRDIAALARIGDLVYEHGMRLLWGPVRHGAGNNIAVYFPDPAGVVVECYTEMQQIYDDEGFAIPEWDPERPDWVSLWAPGRPEGFRNYGVPPASPRVAGDGRPERFTIRPAERRGGCQALDH